MKRETPRPPPTREPSGSNRVEYTYTPHIHPSHFRQPESPYDRTLNRSAVAWLAQLPPNVVPHALAAQFPRIVNRLSRFWDSPRMLDACFDELLVDRRGRRKGFPAPVRDELLALAAYHRELNKAASKDRWASIPERRPKNA